MKGQFTGRHMAAVLVSGFGVVIAVNLFMATLATKGFGGVVVDNSYVASQKFNGWIREARAQTALGWTSDVTRRADGRLLVRTREVPVGATVTAEARRPLGERESRQIAFTAIADDRYESSARLPAGRWIVRVTITSGSDRWSVEDEVA